MRQIKLVLVSLLLMSTYTANAAPIEVEMDFNSNSWSGSFSFDGTSGQAWRYNSSLTVFALTALDIVFSGISNISWDESEWCSNCTPDRYGVVVDANGRAALFGTARDANTGRSWGTGISHRPNEIVGSFIGMRRFVGYDAQVEGSAVQVPEPGILALFGLGLAGMGFARRRKV